MEIKSLLDPTKQKQVLLSILGWLPGHDSVFITALKKVARYAQQQLI